MSISFEKNREKIVAAWKDVLDDKSTTDWSLFGYEGQTNELKVVGSGEGGADELCEDLNSGKIMYAFLRIEDPKTSLKKFLLINWQGEGAPVLRKGTCANHIHDVAKVLAGAHLTINARTEDDMDLERILKKLSAVSSAYSFKDRALPEEQKTPIGTNYIRVIPAKELNPAEMQNFWKKEEEEERHRIELEKDRKRQEVLHIEKEQRAREEKEHQLREKQISSVKLQPAHVPIKTSPQPLSPEKTLSPTRTLTEAERMRQFRSQEARELIGSRVGTAKAMFTQNTSQGQLQTKIATAPPAKPARTSIAQRINALNSAQDAEEEEAIPKPKPVEIKSPEPVIQEEPEPEPVKPEITAIANEDIIQPAVAEDYVENEEQFSTIKRSPHSKTNSVQSPEDNKVEKEVVQPEQHVVTQVAAVSVVNGRNSDALVPNEDELIYQDVISEGNLRARALYDYQAADESEITFDPGDVITHIDQIDEGWWQGLGPDGTYGLFPANYVELMN